MGQEVGLQLGPAPKEAWLFDHKCEVVENVDDRDEEDGSQEPVREGHGMHTVSLYLTDWDTGPT